YSPVFRSSRCFLILTFSFFCVLNFNCTKIDSTDIGADLLPAVDNVNTFDTVLNVIANNFDTASTECFIIYPQDEHSLGYIKNNPLFGTTKSIIYTELKPDVYPFNFPANRTLDSVVLVLSYKAAYGDTTASQKVNVYQISNLFTPDTSSCKFYDYDPTILGSAIYTPQQLKDSVKGFEEASSGQLRIKLSDAFGQLLISRDSSNAFKSDSIFRTFFKGFAIVPDVNFGGNALTYFNLSDTNTKLAVYMKSGTAPIDTSVFNFRLTNLSYSANYVVRDHTGAEITGHLAKPVAGDDLIYIQTTPGTYATIKIPDLDRLSNRIIHRAVLTMDQVYADNTLNNFFSTPNILYLDLKDDTSLSIPFRPVPCDFTASAGGPNITTLGGFRNIVKDPLGRDISRYTFTISRFVQKAVTKGHISSTFRLRAPDAISNPNPLGYFDECGQGISPFFYYPINLHGFGQVKLGGGNNVDYRMKLYILYSKI
ncbi:MAG: DUF4270 family protein, partial [Ginsengibacter sp.]